MPCCFEAMDSIPDFAWEKRITKKLLKWNSFTFFSPLCASIFHHKISSDVPNKNNFYQRIHERPAWLFDAITSENYIFLNARIYICQIWPKFSWKYVMCIHTVYYLFYHAYFIGNKPKNVWNLSNSTFILPIVSVEKISWCYKKDVHVNYYCEIPLMKNKIWKMLL